MSDDSALKADLVDYLQKLDYQATCIEEAETPTPDLRILDMHGSAYVAEVKCRTTPWEAKAEVLTEDPTGRVLKRNDRSTTSNSVAGDLKHAALQLDGGAKEGDLRLVWLFADTSDQQFLYEQVRRTAYGLKLASAIAQGVGATREAYFATYAAFANHSQSIDGILLGRFQGLLLNNLSLRYAQLKASAIAVQCGEYVLDPLEVEKKGECFVVPVGEHPPTPESVKARIGEKYGVTVVELGDFTRFSAVVEVKNG